tara:strand:+ start:4532 stop:6412 length:1881 start_codon:yes stop_codon:yes gene_type:complete
MKTCPVIVIGHVDHGKTSLVRALTGMETDKLPEEKARGLSMTPGFAYRQCGDVMIDFIDAPGHEDFIRAMVSGASGARATLLVISAIEGVQAQTLEHLQIADYLGIHEGIVAITHADRLSKAEYAACESGLRAALAGTRFCDGPFIFCSSTTKEGIGALSDALGRLGIRTNSKEAAFSAFLPVDRVFVADGHGTIVTGTLHGGSINVDDALVLASKGQSITIRGIQVRGQASSQANAGERTALNLRGVSADQIKPGDILHPPNAFAPSVQCDVSISLSTGASRPVKHMEEVRVLYGTAQAVASVRLYDGKQLIPGKSACAQLRLIEGITTFAGQHAIIRSLSPAQTVGGAIILDPLAHPHKLRKNRRLETLKSAWCGDTPGIASALAYEHLGIAHVADICRLARSSAAKVRAELGAQFVDVTDTLVAVSSTVEEVKESYIGRLQSYHEAYPLKPFAPRAHMRVPHTARELLEFVEAVLVSEGKLVISAAGVALLTHDPFDHLTAQQQERMAGITARLMESPLAPPAPESFATDPVDSDLLALLIHEGTAIRLNNVSLKQSLVFHSDAIAAAITTLRSSYPGQTAFSTGEARATLKTTRKFVVPILEHLDSRGATIRIGDTRYMAND